MFIWFFQHLRWLVVAHVDASVLESESHSLTLHGLSDIAHHPGHSECDLETWRLGFGGCILAHSPLA